MSPEQVTMIIGAFAGLIGAIAYVIRQNNNTRNEARKQAIAAKARHDKLENDAKQREDEADNRQRAILDGFVIDFNKKNEDQQKRIEFLSKDLQTALIDNARLEGQLKELIRNQGIDRNKMEQLSNRVHELETDKKRDIETINKQDATIEALRKKLSDNKDMIAAKILHIHVLEGQLNTLNGTEAIETAVISVVADDNVQSNISNVQTPITGDNEDTAND